MSSQIKSRNVLLCSVILFLCTGKSNGDSSRRLRGLTFGIGGITESWQDEPETLLPFEEPEEPIKITQSPTSSPTPSPTEETIELVDEELLGKDMNWMYDEETTELYDEETTELYDEETTELYVEETIPDVPTEYQTISPTLLPSKSPSTEPSTEPSSSPTHVITSTPTGNPTSIPSSTPLTQAPTSEPSSSPSARPSFSPTEESFMDKMFDTEHEIIDIVQNPTADGLGLFLVLIAVIGMILTAWQLLENPDGLCSSCCRYSVQISRCMLKVLCLPCSVFCGKYTGYQGTDPANRAKFLTPEEYTHDLELENEGSSGSDVTSRSLT